MPTCRDWVATLAVVGALCLATIATSRHSFATALGGAEPTTPNSADRVIFWSGCGDLLAMDDAELSRWKKAGVGGFTCGMNQLYGMGGPNRFSADVAKVPAGKAYALERALSESQIVQRVHAQGMQLYLGWYLSNSLNPRTPLADWFDDVAWQDTVLPEVRNVATAANELGFDGLAWDLELYPQTDGRTTATWNWDYPGNRRAETAVREKVRQRGAEFMAAATQGFPDATVLAYHSEFPNTWESLVQLEVNGTNNAYAESANLDFWDGATSLDGDWSLHFLNAIFYKTTHLDASWDVAYSYELNRLFELFSKRLTNWSEVADQVYSSPFVWISAGSSDFEAARGPAYVAEQLKAARRWGMGRMFANYTSDTLRTFRYKPYLPGLKAAARPGIVDNQAPTLTVDSPNVVSGSTTDLAGTAADNMAVRVVRWRTDSGASGAAVLDWIGEGNPTSGLGWHTDWKAVDVPVHAGTTTITVTVEDVKGLTASRLIRVSR